MADIVLYPVKSLSGVSIKTAEVEPWGLRHDRRWLVLRPDGTVLTARQEHTLLALTAAPLESGGIVMSAPDGSTWPVDPPVDGEQVPVVLSRLDWVRLACRDASEWLSTHIRQTVRLGWLDNPNRRSVSLMHGGRPGEPLSLADAGPLLLTSVASLCQVNEWLATEVEDEPKPATSSITMRRFRPNLVIEGAIPPFVEDDWKSVRIGDVLFRLSEHCDRCVMTTIDPETLATGKQPLRILARHRQWNHKTWFGIRLIPANVGRILVGNVVSGAQ